MNYIFVTNIYFQDATTFSITTLRIMTLSIKTLSITTLSMTTVIIMGSFETLSIKYNDTQHTSIKCVMLSSC